MAKYRLLADHLDRNSNLIPAGSEVGDDCRIKWEDPPSLEMVPLDADAKSKIDKLHKEVYGRDGPEIEETAPVTEEKDFKGGPVTEQQRKEREEGRENDRAKGGSFVEPRGGVSKPIDSLANPTDTDLSESTRPAYMAPSRPTPLAVKPKTAERIAKEIEEEKK